LISDVKGNPKRQKKKEQNLMENLMMQVMLMKINKEKYHFI
jgi:hypothetical protein